MAGGSGASCGPGIRPKTQFRVVQRRPSGVRGAVPNLEAGSFLACSGFNFGTKINAAPRDHRAIHAASASPRTAPAPIPCRGVAGGRPCPVARGAFSVGAAPSDARLRFRRISDKKVDCEHMNGYFSQLVFGGPEYIAPFSLTFLILDLPLRQVMIRQLR